MNSKKYSKTEINKAGDILRKRDSTEEKINEAFEKLSYWREIHYYPTKIFKRRLEKTSKLIDPKSIVSSRLKRTPSILKKIDRLTTRLTQIQDIAGCRAVLDNTELINKLYQEYYKKGDLKHKLKRETNYITYPKEDGYRGIHLIYEFKSDKEAKKKYNGLQVEIQIRSKIQHIWSTAVETTSFFIGQALKLNEGEEEWKEFFKLVSSAFAKMEKCPIINGTPDNEETLYKLIKEKEKKLDVIKKMETWMKSIRFIDTTKNKNKNIYLLKLNLDLREMNIIEYSERQENKAIEDYLSYEKDIYNKKGYDVVLVKTNTLKDLKKAYPNYFLDTKDFVELLKKIVVS